MVPLAKAARTPRLQVSLAVGVALGIAAGLVNAVQVWPPGGWSRTPIFLTSALAHAALGAALGALLGGWRTLRLRAGAERRVALEATRDGFALLFVGAAAYLVGAAISAVSVLGSAGPLLAMLAAALLAAWVTSRLAARLLGAAVERLLRRPRVATALGRVRWRLVGGLAATALVLAALLPPLLAGPPPTENPPVGSAPQGAPNVILIVLDTTRADRVSAYGHSRATTPQIDRIAAGGILYEQAVSAGVWTLPGHAGIFTGAPSSVHGANGRRLFLHRSLTTLAEVLARNGYATAGFSNNPWVARATGMARGFGHFEDHWRLQTFEPLHLLHQWWQEMQAHRRNAEVSGGAAYTLARVDAWIEELRAASDAERPPPFFVFVNLMEAHEPRTYRAGYTDRFLKPGQQASRLRQVPREIAAAAARGRPLTREQLELLRMLYDGELRFVDQQIGAFVRDLDRRGILDETLVVITSDHGEAIGDHGKTSHLQSVYEELVHVPLILRHPRLPAGLRVSTRVQTYDLFRTIVEFVGITEPLPDDARLSRNLLEPALLGGSSARRSIVSEEEPSEWGMGLLRSVHGRDADVSEMRRRYKAYYEGDLKYVWRSDGKRELYDLATDPRERRDLAQRRPADVERLDRALTDWVEGLPANRIDEDGESSGLGLDPEAQRALRALGYVE